MSTKGPSNRYGGTSGAGNNKGTRKINYPWAKGFTKRGLIDHFKRHHKELGVLTPQEYESKGVHFANTVDRKNFNSVVDYRGTTYKWNKNNGNLVEVTKTGYIISYRNTGNKFWYYKRKGEKVWINTGLK